MSDAEAPSVELEQLNISELLQLLKEPERGGHRLKKAVPIDRLIHLIRTGETPEPSEFAATIQTRAKLEVWVSKNIDAIGSQLPCSGPTRGKCSIHPCSDGKHLDCYLAAKEHLI